MSSPAPRLDELPRDVLQHIAFLSAAGASYSTGTILGLLKTSSTLYRVLNLAAAPDLYAHIFRLKFDMAAPSRRYLGQLTDSALAGELVNRYRLLHRVQRMDFSRSGLLHDLYTALWMLLENDGLNAQQLAAVSFGDFALGLTHAVLGPQHTEDNTRSDTHNVKAITVWLLGLSLRRRVLLDMVLPDLDALYAAIYPFAFPPSKPAALPPAVSDVQHLPAPHTREAPSPDYSAGAGPVWRARPLPDTSTAAINLVCAICEAWPVQIPPHLLAAARASGDPAPATARALAGSVVNRTVLPADCVLPSTAHDLPFCGTLGASAGAGADDFAYVPGTLTAMWEGTYKSVHVPGAGLAQATFMKPMHVQIAEYVCTGGAALDVPCDMDGSDISVVDRSDTRLVVDGRVYHRYEPGAPLGDAPLRDVILLGEAAGERAYAWGEYRFAGRVSRDGLVVLRRTEKDGDGDSGAGYLVFSGRVHARAMLLGRWRIGESPELGEGVFSMERAQ